MTFQVEFATQPKVLNVEFDTALNISGGYDDGYNDGFSQGKSEGLTEGEAIGYGKGSSEAMQEFVDSRGLKYLYYNQTVSDGMLDWLTKVDLSSITSLASMFRGSNLNSLTEFPVLDARNATNTSSMFREASLKKALYLNTANVKNMSYMFQQSNGLNECPAYDYSNVEDTVAMFQQTYSLKSLSPIVFPSGKTNLSCYMMFYLSRIETIDITFNSPSKAESMFNECPNLVTADLKNTHWWTTASSMFSKCYKLKSIPSLDLINVKSISSMFSSCYVLTEISLSNTQNVTNISSICSTCKALVSISTIDMRSVTSASSAFNNCYALTNLTVKNIKTNLQVGSGTSYGHLLTLESLISLCYELRDTGSNLTLTVGSANLEKLANVYVREIPITDAMREADDLIDEKLPFERCESTADGATLITDYVLLKNWKLA